MSKFVPEQGEMVLASEDFEEREFIGMSIDGRYLCWNKDKTEAFSYNKVHLKPDEPAYYYRWEKLLRDTIQISTFMNDEYAKLNNFSEEDGWHRLEDTKRTWEH